MLLSTSIDKIPFSSIWHSTPNYDFEGDWMMDPYAKNMPQKQPCRYTNIESFLKKLLDIQETLETILADKPNNFCSICLTNNDEGQNYSILVDGREIRWSKGLFHYYDEHNILPSQQFYNIIMSYSMKKPRRSKKDGKKEFASRNLARRLKYMNIN